MIHKRDLHETLRVVNSILQVKLPIMRRETEVKFSFKFSFQTKAFDDYAFILLKLIARRIFVFLNGLF